MGRHALGGTVAGYLVLLLALTTGPTVSSAASFAALPGKSATPPSRVAPTTVLESKPAPPTGSRPDRRPNIILITTDDQTSSDMRWMPFTRRLLGDAGTTFRQMLTPHPLCCPARAAILTGQYAQNNGVRSNHAELLGGFSRLDNTRTVATWLRAAGYRTAFVGKYLNDYDQDRTLQPGWDIFNPTIRRTYGYVGYTTLNNGAPRTYERLYNPDLVSRKTRQYVRELSGRNRPFFIWASHVAPHLGCVYGNEKTCQLPPPSAKRHQGLFKGVDSPSFDDPAFNEADMRDKPAGVANNKRVSAAYINTLFRARIRALQAVDEGVRSTVRALRRAGELDNTYVLFTTDNGYLLGEHRIAYKNVPYEQAIRFPLLMRGPGVPRDVTSQQTVTMVDLAPTFLDAADAKANLTVDGTSILPLVANPRRPGAETVLIQAGPRRPAEVALGWGWRGVRTDRYTYVRMTSSGFVEMYDRARDPAELENVASNPAYLFVAAELAQRLKTLQDCSGAACQQRFGPLPEPLQIPD